MLNARSEAPRVWVLVAWGALAAGLGELLVRILVLHWSASFDKSFVLNPQSVWMGPIASLPIMAMGVGLAWLFASRSRFERIRFGLPLGVVLFLVAWQVLLTTSRVHPLALAVLAIGFSLQVVRLAESRRALTARALMVSMWSLALASAAGGVGWNTWRFLKEFRSQRDLAVVDADAPNVLLLILDTVRASQLSVYGYARPTSPMLARLAHDGVRFDRAISTAPWTLPSHASMFTGRYPHELDVGWDRPLGPREPTLAEAFGRAGYVTGGFVANTIYASWLHGLSRGFQHYSDYPITLSETLGASNFNRRVLRWWNGTTQQYWTFGRKSAEDVNTEFLSWIDRRAGQRPFFAFLNYFDAHMPYLPPRPFRSLYLEGEPPTRDVNMGPRVKRPPEVITGLRDAYDGAITYLDTQLDSLFTALSSRGLWENTIIIVTADHGEAFGEHGFTSHGASLFLPEIHVPLIIRMPRGVGRGCIVRDGVSLRDLPATLTAAASLGEAAQFPGHSLLKQCDDRDTAELSPVISESEDRTHLPAWYPAAAGPMKSLILDNRHYIRIGASDQLYDLSIDPGELRDLSADSAHANVLKQASRALDETLARSKAGSVDVRVGARQR